MKTSGIKNDILTKCLIIFTVLAIMPCFSSTGRAAVLNSAQDVYRDGDTIAVGAPPPPTGQDQYVGFAVPGFDLLILEDLNSLTPFDGVRLPLWRGGERILEVPVTEVVPLGRYTVYLVYIPTGEEPLGALADGLAAVESLEFTVEEKSPECGYAVSSGTETTVETVSFEASGGGGDLNVETPDGCAWAVSVASGDWISITSGENGTGNGSFGYSVAPNTGTEARTGTIIAAGLTITVNQAGAVNTGNGTLPDLAVFTFGAVESKTLPGTSGELESGVFGCDGIIKPADTIGDLALVSLFYQNGCYTDGRYNNGNFRVERGTVTGGSGGRQLAAYTVHEPANKASEFLASDHAVFYRFPTREDYAVYRFSDGNISLLADVPADRIDTGTFIKLETLLGSSISGSVTYLFVPAATRVSVYTELNPGVEGARIQSNELGDLLKYRYRMEGTPFDTRNGFPNGPNTWENRYSPRRNFFPVAEGGELGVVWQDTGDMSVHLTWLGGEMTAPADTVLANARSEVLAAAAGDEGGNIYYLTIQPGEGADSDTARSATLYKAGRNGGEISSSIQDTSKDGLNMVTFTGNIGYTADLKYAGGMLGLMLGRQMHRASDGLNHQGGIAVVFDAETLSVVKNHGQTSGHSFSNVLGVNDAGEFVGIDLGDNFPRGVNLHRFGASSLNSRVVYTFKTAHGTSPTSPAGATYPLYTEISGAENFYQWSNDNNTYTELGGVIEGSGSYTVVFAGEAKEGRALDNGLTGEYLNVSRNIGLVRVVSGFQSKRFGESANVVTDDIILSQGPAETGGFYTFGGDWAEQRNTGIVWLTDYDDPDTENVSRLKTAKLVGGDLLLLWEKWTPTDYAGTYAVKIDEDGTRIGDIVELGAHVRLNRRDDPFVVGNKVFLFSGDAAAKTLELVVLEGI